MDDHTTNMSKTKFTRVCVTIAADFKFPQSIPVNLGCRLDIVKAECRWKPNACTKCLIFGHTEKNCDSAVAVPLATNVRRPVEQNKKWCAKQPCSELRESNLEVPKCANSRESVMEASELLAETPGLAMAMGSSRIGDGDTGISISNRFALLEADDEHQMEGAMESPVHSQMVEPKNPSVEHNTDSTLGNVNEAIGGTALNLDDTCKFLKTIDSCLNICNIIAEKPVAPLV